mmetsp:Transcript_9335/g.16241  ORF Transcript_9335/g.16241 Transcript_9335/m.16241 type:complete len:256 (+) Transcript_9335:95-862(+)
MRTVSTFCFASVCIVEGLSCLGFLHSGRVCLAGGSKCHRRNSSDKLEGGFMMKLEIHYSMGRGRNLVVLSVGLSLGIKDTRPVFGLEVGLVVNINLNLNTLSRRLNRVSGDTDGVEKSSNKLSEARWAPLHNLSGLEAELGSEDRVGDGSVIRDLSEGEGLVDRGALVSKSVDGSLGVDGNADSKATGNTRGGGSRGGEVVSGDAWHVFELGTTLLGVEGGGVSGLLGRGEGGGRANKSKCDDRLHFELRIIRLE